MANIEKLRAKINDSGMTVTAICEKAGMSRETFYNRLKGSDFKVQEVLALKKTLRMTYSEMREIFLA